MLSILKIIHAWNQGWNRFKLYINALKWLSLWLCSTIIFFNHISNNNFFYVQTWINFIWTHCGSRFYRLEFIIAMARYSVTSSNRSCIKIKKYAFLRIESQSIWFFLVWIRKRYRINFYKFTMSYNLQAWKCKRSAFVIQL